MKLKQTNKQKKINETKTQFFDKIKKIYSLLASLTKKKREKIQRSSTRNEMGDITVDITEIQKIFQGYLQHLYPCKLENLEEMVKFLERYNSQLKSGQLDTLNRPITSSEIEMVIKKLPTKKVQDQMDSQDSSIRYSKRIGTSPVDTIPQDRQRGNPP